jgi:hypothetical protein
MTRSQRFGGVLLGSLGLWWSTPVAAQPATADFGHKGQFVISGERLFGLVASSISTTRTQNNVEEKTTQSYTTFNLLMNPTSPTTYAVPRVGFDYLPIDGLTVGGSLGFSTSSGEVEREEDGTSVTQDTGSGSTFLLAPRAGYVFMFTPVFGIWPRGGITFVHMSGEDEDGYPKVSRNRLALTMEVPFVVTPIPHVGFTFAPTLDLGLTGSDKVTDVDNDNVETTTEADVVATDIGIQAGLFVYF